MFAFVLVTGFFMVPAFIGAQNETIAVGINTTRDVNTKHLPLFFHSNLVQRLMDTMLNLVAKFNRTGSELSMLNNYIWERINEKKQMLLSNPHAAIYGFGQGGHNYPFAYRNVNN
ncbi:hypothetical protein FQA39_LY16242 [Lamprigera yunnana]|nr:hypothetical protein FQA39_LY16242 [Lamprigera yunnana]